jgi:hypothetical protein
MIPDPVPQPTYRGCPVVLVRLRKGRRCMNCRTELWAGQLAWRRSEACDAMERNQRVCVPCQATQKCSGG